MPGIPRVMAYLASFPGGPNMSGHWWRCSRLHRILVSCPRLCIPRVMAYLASFHGGPNMSGHYGGVLVYTESSCRAHAWYTTCDGLPRLVPWWSQHEWSLRRCSRLHRILVSYPRLVYHVWWLTSPRSLVVPTWVITKAVFSSTPNPRVVPTPGIPRVMAYLASFPGGPNMSDHQGSVLVYTESPCRAHAWYTTCVVQQADHTTFPSPLTTIWRISLYIFCIQCIQTSLSLLH